MGADMETQPEEHMFRQARHLCYIVQQEAALALLLLLLLTLVLGEVLLCLGSGSAGGSRSP